MSKALDPHHKTRRLAKRRSQLISYFCQITVLSALPSTASDYLLLFQDSLN